MKYKKLKPILTGSVFLLPAFLFLNGSVKETNAMMRGALSKLPSLNKFNLPNMKNMNMPKLNKPNFNTKLNPIKLPTGINKVNIPKGKPVFTLGKSYSLKNNTSSTKPTILKSNSFGGTINPSISKPLSKNQTATNQPPKLEPRQPITNNPNVNFEKLDPGYNTVPKPIFTPKDPSKPLPEPEVYQNIVILNTNAGSLTLFKE